MPWCIMDRDKSKVYVADDGGKISGSYENVTASTGEKTHLTSNRDRPVCGGRGRRQSRYQ